MQRSWKSLHHCMYVAQTLAEERRAWQEKALEWKKEKERAELQASSDVMVKAHEMIERMQVVG
jgi:hypothetical protein